MLRAPNENAAKSSPSSSGRSLRRRSRKPHTRRHGSRAAVKMVPRVETLEPRHLLSAILPAYVNDEFTFGDATSLAPYGLEHTFSLQSRPGATKTIYLDFDGHHSVGNSWGHDIQFPAFNRDGNPNSFSDSELIEIQKQFQNVAEDFLPFDVNVTTLDPGVAALAKSSINDSTWGIRAVNTQPTDGFGSGIGGIAYLNSFSYNEDTPVFTFNKGARNGGMTNSHEVGHALGLRHQGLDNQSYHPGTGIGQTSWGPLLGAPFGKRLTQWSNSDYDGATINQDDLTVITSNRNGFGYRDDDHGNSLQAATVLPANENQQLSSWGIVERTEDQDWFSFHTGAGDVRLNIDAFGQDPNLDIEAKLHDASGNVIAISNPLNETNASFNLELVAGQYFLSVDGVGLEGQNSDYGSIGFFSLRGTIVESNPEFVVGESGEINDLNHEWQTVQLVNQYENPAIVVGPLSFNGKHESTIRIRNVTSSSFDVRVQEWNYLDGWHTNETASYAVVESGVHTLADGSVIVAGVSSVSTSWQSLSFGHEFDSSPVVLSQSLTEAESDAIVTRQRNVTSNSFSLRLQEEEALGPHLNEDVGWLAVGSKPTGAGSSQLHTFINKKGVNHRRTHIQFPDLDTAKPFMLAAMQTSTGSDTASLRVTNLTADGAQVWVDEEQSSDRETRHTHEVVGGIVLGGGNLLATSSREGSDNDQPPSNNENAVGEAGWVLSLNHEWQTIQLQHTYDNPAIAFGPLSFNGSHESTVRIRNVTATSFDVRIQEWNFLDEWHTTEHAGFMVIESGVHTLPDGTVIAAGVQQNSDSRWQDIQFGHQFETTPVVISQTTTMSEHDAVVTRQKNITPAGFRMMLQEEEANGGHGAEDASWIAIATHQTTDSPVVSAYTTDHSITHRRATLPLNATSDQTQVVLAAMQSFAESDTANLRFDNLRQETFQIWVDEERSGDRETQHVAEAVGVVALSQGTIISHDHASGSGNDSNSGRGSSENPTSNHFPVPAINYIPTDGTLGEATYLAPGHAGHDCETDHDHDHDEHQPDHDCHDHGDSSHAPGCSCGNCLALASKGVKDPTDHGEHDIVANVAASLTDSRASQPGTPTIQPEASLRGEHIPDAQKREPLARVSYFATQNELPERLYDKLLATNSSNSFDIIRTQDSGPASAHAGHASQETRLLPSTRILESSSNENTESIDAFFSQSSADVNFRNLI